MVRLLKRELGIVQDGAHVEVTHQPEILKAAAETKRQPRILGLAAEADPDADRHGDADRDADADPDVKGLPRVSEPVTAIEIRSLPGTPARRDIEIRSQPEISKAGVSLVCL
jgi:hypothetical protein